MTRLLKWIAGLLAVGILLVAIAAVQVIYFKPLSIRVFFERVFLEFALEDPELLSRLRILEPLGIQFHHDDLTDVSVRRSLELQDKLQRDLQTLRRYDRDALDSRQQLSYDVLEHFLEVQAAGGEFAFHNYPVNQLGGVQTGLVDFMVTVHSVASKADGDNYVTRLNKFPWKFDQVLEGLQYRQERGIVPPRFVVDKVLAQMGEFIAQPATKNVLYTSLEEKLEPIDIAEIDPTNKQRLLNRTERAISNQVYPAYQRLIGFFQTLEHEDNYGAWKLPDGEAFYDHQIRYHTTTELSADEVHEMGLSEVARIEAQMNELLVQEGLTEGSVGARVTALSADPAQLYPDNDRGRQAIIDDFQAIIDEIDGKLEPVFDLRPEMGVIVERVPEFSQDGAPGAYYRAPPLDGSKPGVFYINLRSVREIPKLGMRTLAYHEAIPGHHFQIALQQEITGVPTFRKIVPFTVFSEGWALYAERLAAEMSMLPTTLDDLGRLQAEMFRAVRLVVDTGLHRKRWSREQAIEYMLEKTGMPQGDVVAEVERYMVIPGQALAYKIGMIRMLELRERARQALGERFDIREFHNVVLGSGAMPLNLLERRIDDYIRAEI